MQDLPHHYQVTAITVQATLTVPAGTDQGIALKLMEKADSACLISNSLTAGTQLEARVIYA
jgi:organic hydroperoxide reductase OsmC/OhrA